MIEDLLSSLTLNSVGLLVLSLGIIVSYIFRRRRTVVERLPVRLNDKNSSLFLTLVNHKMLFFGVAAFIASLFLIYQNHSKTVITRNRTVIIDTHNTIVEKNGFYTIDENMVLKMEQSLDLRLLSKRITKEIKDWSTDIKDMDKWTTSEPLCIMLLEIYIASSAERETLAYERAYRDFYQRYYGRTEFDEMIDNFRMALLIKKEAERQREQLKRTTEIK